MYEISLSMSLLYLVLGSAALWGLLVMIGTLLLGLAVSKRLEHFQDQVLKHKDSRMSIVNEILNGIRIIKLFAWEDNMMKKLAAARAVEVNCLSKFLFTNVVSQIIC